MTYSDYQQACALREVYNGLLYKKDNYLEDVKRRGVITTREYLCLDVGFRLLTLELKMVESKIHWLMFGGELPIEPAPKPLKYYLNLPDSDTVYYEYLSELNSLRHRLGEQTAHVNAQTAVIFKLKKELETKNTVIEQRDKEISKMAVTILQHSIETKTIVRLPPKKAPRRLTEAQKKYRERL